MGGQKRIDAIHANGQLTVREHRSTSSMTALFANWERLPPHSIQLSGQELPATARSSVTHSLMPALLPLLVTTSPFVAEAVRSSVHAKWAGIRPGTEGRGTIRLPRTDGRSSNSLTRLEPRACDGSARRWAWLGDVIRFQW